jgi:hypothetical protein
MLWVHQYGKGRVYSTVLGHGPDQIRLSPGYVSLLQRGAEWAGNGKVTIPIPKNLDAPVGYDPRRPRRPGPGSRSSCRHSTLPPRRPLDSQSPLNQGVTR